MQDCLWIYSLNFDVVEDELYEVLKPHLSLITMYSMNI